jgi:3-oxoacyl-[acyl-carrier protein] reductase
MSAALEGKVAIVTGAAHGLGRAYAHRLAAHGAAVVVADIDEDGSKTVAADIQVAGGRALGIGVDVSDADGLAAMADQAVTAFGGIDVLVNNAAIFLTVGMSRVGFDEITEDEWDRMMAVNVRGTWLACRAVVPHMRTRGYGKIVNVSSDTALKGSPNRIHYVASKSAVLGFTRTLAAELGADGIRVNAIAPGIVLSEEEPTEQRRAHAVGSQILTEPLFPDDLAETVVFLSSPTSDAITGQILAINGGGYM